MDNQQSSQQNRFSGYMNTDWKPIHNFDGSRGLDASLASLSFSQPNYFGSSEHEQQVIGANNAGGYINGNISQTSNIMNARLMNPLTQGSAGSRGDLYWSMDQRDAKLGRDTTSGTLTTNSIMDTSLNVKNSDYNTTYGSTDNHENYESLQLELQLKETQIESLESEIQSLKQVFNQGLLLKQKHDSRAPSDPQTGVFVEIPSSLEAIFHKLSQSLASKDKELEETKLRLESLVTAIALNPTNSVTKLGRYDEEALAHKMVVRLENLTKENQDMARMLGYGRSKEVHIEMELLRKENQELKRKMQQIERKAVKG
ncbi:LAME_0H13696g1_1 [Lachancea meyersii CBS 8951]|uniref:LAME_0H13696g1_1 n=1 Tax=Lachancea meyersii CBS 8951 TaxID=1266667 RepID=A0A1G4KHD8_9SACH|nr:LAME_0H13696g1_1 [Lachancea meyersii CBS 8951]